MENSLSIQWATLKDCPFPQNMRSVTTPIVSAKNDLIVVSAGLLAAVTLFTCPVMAADSNSASDGHGAFATGQYRNLFAENGHSQVEIQNKINSAFTQLFHGDPATQAIYYSAGENS